MSRLICIVLLSLAAGGFGTWAIQNLEIRTKEKPNTTVVQSEAEPRLLPRTVREHVVAQPDKIVQTAFLTNGTTTAETPDTSKIVAAEETFGTGNTVVTWPITATGQTIRILNHQGNIKVRMPGPASNYKIFINGKQKDGSNHTTVTTKENDFIIPLESYPATKLSIGVSEKSATPVFELTIIKASPPVDHISVTQVYNSPSLTNGADVTANAVDVINGYIRLRGKSSNPPAFLLVGSNGNASALDSPIVSQYDPITRDWEYAFQLPNLPTNQTGFIAVRTIVNGDHFSNNALVPIKWISRTNLTKPEFADPAVVAASKTVKKDESSQPNLPVYITNSQQVTIKVKNPSETQAVRLTVMNLITNSTTTSQTLATTGSELTFTGITFDREGEYRIMIEGMNGASTGEKSLLKVKFSTTGPIVSLNAPGFGSNGGTETIAIQFAGQAMNEDTINDTRNFSVIHIENNNAPKRMTFITYDKLARIATFKIDGVVPGTYNVLISDKVLDIFGNPPQNRNQEGNVVINISAMGQAPALPSQSSIGAMTLQTGPNVTFPEYTKFRKVPDGFNPSDRVETRVIRLYYNRDAGQVAQIVNRDVKAYNASNVDIRRRAADRKRDDANKSQDDRQRFERAAVESAKKSREIEHKLADLQSQLTSARQELANESNVSAAREKELLQSQRDLTRSNLDTQIRAEASVDPQSKQLNQLRIELEQEIARLDAEIAVAGLKDKKLADADIMLLTQQQVAKNAETAYRQKYAEIEKTDEVQVNNAKVQAAKTELANAKDAASKPGLTGTQLIPLQAAVRTAEQNLRIETDKAILSSSRASEVTTAETNYTTELKKTEVLQNGVLSMDKKAVRDQQLTQTNAQITQLQQSATNRATLDKSSDPNQKTVESLNDQIKRIQGAQLTSQKKVTSLEADVAKTQADLQAARSEEVRTNEIAIAADASEKREREEQFRREVAAARENPDIYVPGVPDSDDPVRQCSLSVVGEGLIQIRGPIKGLNVIRTMINQLDSPVGQVKIAVHTMQINGEREDRMEKVAANVQWYIDHSRFLTTQSAQMLRKSVAMVASRKASEACAFLPTNASQAERDLKYLHAFFGREFIEELRQMDSEFLKTGNKLLSLHSMDSTSLSSALTLIALAKNSVRLEILQTFMSQIMTQLPIYEQNYYEQGLLCTTKCEACCDKKFCSQASNARFQSFLGHFDAQIQGDDTMTPIQREFTKLAMIYKNRLVTELHLKQRVMERSLLEDRDGTNYLEKLQEAARLEERAKKELESQLVIRQVVGGNISRSLYVALSGTVDEVQEALANIGLPFGLLRDDEKSRSGDIKKMTKGENDIKERMLSMKSSQKLDNELSKRNWKESYQVKATITNGKITFSGEDLRQLQGELRDLMNTLQKFDYPGIEQKHHFTVISKAVSGIINNNGEITTVDAAAADEAVNCLRNHIRNILKQFAVNVADIGQQLQSSQFNMRKVYNSYVDLRASALTYLRDKTLRTDLTTKLRDVDDAFMKAFETEAKYIAANEAARKAYSRIDEKKLLDLLVDEAEDRHIELVEGTRAHIANIDNYIKLISTALDDDFNRQFYQPAFRRIRESATGWAVHFGQIETTSVLTNNRSLGKVSPAATMEFDLPKRDIMVTEGFKAAKAIMQENGALLNDPTFLSLVKLYSGLPPAAGFGANNLSAVRNVLPGLPTTADEMIMAQAGSNQKEFGSSLSALIPDPAIYKFETGTGYEIRPVLSPDGQSVVFNFNYMYTTDVREPVRADEKHLGRVKRHFIHDDVQLSNFELREVSKYNVALKAARTSRGVALLQDVPIAGALFRPLPSASSSLQQNQIYAQTTIFPTLFDLMGLRYAPAVADITPERTRYEEWVLRNRRLDVEQRIYDIGSSRVDEALRIPLGERRPDLYRGQFTLPYQHPNGYEGGGLRLRDSHLVEQPYDPKAAYPQSNFHPSDVKNLPPVQQDMSMPGHSLYPSGPTPFYNASPFPQGAGPDPRYAPQMTGTPPPPPIGAGPDPRYAPQMTGTPLPPPIGAGIDPRYAPQATGTQPSTSIPVMPAPLPANPSINGGFPAPFRMNSTMNEKDPSSSLLPAPKPFVPGSQLPPNP